jgi:hypothetical protein
VLGLCGFDAAETARVAGAEINSKYLLTDNIKSICRSKSIVVASVFNAQEDFSYLPKQSPGCGSGHSDHPVNNTLILGGTPGKFSCPIPETGLGCSNLNW